MRSRILWVACESYFLFVLPLMMYNGESFISVGGEMLAGVKESADGHSGYISRLSSPILRCILHSLPGGSFVSLGWVLQLQTTGSRFGIAVSGPPAAMRSMSLPESSFVFEQHDKKGKTPSCSQPSLRIKDVHKPLQQPLIPEQRLVRLPSCGRRAVPGSCGASS